MVHSIDFYGQVFNLFFNRSAATVEQGLALFNCLLRHLHVCIRLVHSTNGKELALDFDILQIFFLFPL